LAGDAGGITLSNAFSGVTDLSVVFTWSGSSYSDYTFYEGFGWFDPSFTPSDDVLVGQGDAVWLKMGSSGADAIMAGEVPMAGSITNTLGVGFNLVANPYPVAMTLGDIPAASVSDLDVVFLWNGSSYEDYTFYAGFGWFDPSFNPAETIPVAVGQGFWLKSAAGGALIFDKNF
jgi:hypothetical protein